MDNTPENDYFSSKVRELRHNPCLMTPLSAAILFLFAAVSVIGFILNFPSMALGFLLGPIFARKAWFIEFLYPLGIGRWGHLFLVKLTSNKNKTHSQILQQRIEVIPDKLYIHPISQLLDNLAYLVVCCDGDGALGAFVVDCGHARECLEQIDAIRERHYHSRQLELQAVLCTHKHHDHTAGNKELLEYHPKAKIYGADVERVPHCTNSIQNGDLLDLPKCADCNDMNDFARVEVICVPGHTRGSVAYSLQTMEYEDKPFCFLFTGDTMFSGGGGVPFEADYQGEQGKNVKGGGYIRASAGMNATERCFAELAVRSNLIDSPSNVLIFPGHEYTTELLNRQFVQNAGDISHWSKFSPAVFFRTVSQLYVTNHRRALPQGKLLTVPSLLSAELNINPIYRRLHKRGEDIIRAVQLWYRLFARTVLPSEEHNVQVNNEMNGKAKKTSRRLDVGTKSNRIWNVKTEDISKQIFTAVYTSDLDRIIEQVVEGEVDLKKLAQDLRDMKNHAEEQVIGRRPIPGTLPNEKAMYNACLALAVIGSPPCAMTFSDSHSLGLPKPVSPGNTHKIKVSLERVLTILSFLGLISDDVDGLNLTAQIRLLWREAAEYGISDKYKSNVDHEVGDDDTMELGVLRWMLFGIEANQPTWFERYCMPCGRAPPQQNTIDHPLNQMGEQRRTNGELIKHDPTTCELCRSMTGCAGVEVCQACLKEAEVVETEHDDSMDVPVNSMSPQRAAATQMQSIQLQFPPSSFSDADPSMPPNIYRLNVDLDDKVETIQTVRTF
mmetsp:Transcript_20780/g.30762  ORF Transcript_20780/g.30762 Transcript_20780/m.30762 type:complete len:780 (-) Transcript_20780:3-2342(-)|eukprot:CAMPEP_0194248366 /NCGR_PEP_ID=MMETSP0158-20130606/18172_1 /TAXON_ID=33649 /ORGANISM="Thalassionema nitzschioides, Strain L26-B" /LENGTH=779 /DNA_ID=CAMNT_0038984649 /DNA_START=90 /DNA_END=2429 /DNA_ORIENTATION=+